jgi:biopolymer transport protein ExbD
VRPTPRKRPRPSQLLNGIDFWAFLSVEVALLIIFLVNLPSPHDNRSPVDLARTQHADPLPAALREDAMLVAVTRDGNVFYGTQQIQPNDLPTAIQDAVRRGSERKVYLQVDARAHYGDAVVVIDQVRQAGIENIGIITDQRPPILQ